MEQRARISVRGVVQGVGFRPFVYRLAREHGLRGWVRNTSGSVEIEAEGDADEVRAFLEAFPSQVPPRARVDTLETSFAPVAGYEGFVIRESHRQEGAYQLVSPDIATCADCVREILSPEDRRAGYPFTNCTNCGPRFTIIEDIPYDRPKTTMAPFTMCPQCAAEYGDPLDRRFHAQPNACPACGPTLELTDVDGNTLPTDDPLHAAADRLREGQVLAVKGLGGFHLVCDATDETAVRTLRRRKRRPAKPFAVMMTDLAMIERHAEVGNAERDLLSAPQAPIVLLRWREDSTVAPSVAPGSRDLGVMLPYTPLHHLLLRDVDRPLVMTSANVSGEPLVAGRDEALRKLPKIADAFLFHNRAIHIRCDDSVCRVDGEATQVVRRARGYAPSPIDLPFSTRPILACGAELRNTFCLTRDAHAFLSPHIGDMENEETLDHYEAMIAHYEALFRIEPEVVACDLHPEYTATKVARALAEAEGLPCVAVQHHHAHVASCLAEHGVHGPVIGVAFDGTGYGTDGAIWGGEFLIADLARFERVGHFQYLPMAGGEAAIRKPYRMALGALHTLFEGPIDLTDLSLRSVDPVEARLIADQIDRGLNAPLTSSAGRLFDAVSALIGIRGEIDYDAQAAIELEANAWMAPSESGRYPYTVTRDSGLWVIQWQELFAAVLADLRARTAASAIARRFHNTLAAMTASVCRQIAAERGIRSVVLTGGVFGNRLLSGLVAAALHEEGLDVLTHGEVPGNDGGISLGQAVVAHFETQETKGV